MSGSAAWGPVFVASHLWPPLPAYLCDPLASQIVPEASNSAALFQASLSQDGEAGMKNGVDFVCSWFMFKL